MIMDAPIGSQQSGEGRGRSPCARRSALGIKLTALLLFVALLLLAFLVAMIRGLG
ncbi:hypothetical protein HPS36_06325 [Halorubrum salinarum]|uniref:Uncharacterized protein n=1 Tax=Halorubrum salinarum TaxID=2739057 RepID=A0A7D4BRK2_9EURY|nr:hypothetical protein [Halorubrum salinarum]QKG92480.1 hypothetical protein HPS36_06325 [Halorubrum salinarum]